MKKEYKIGLFFILILVVALTAVLIWRRQIVNNLEQENEMPNAPIDSRERLYEENDAVSEVQKVEVTTNCDTVCIYENIDKKDGAVSLEMHLLPAKYIGLKREELEAALEEDSSAPTLADREKGFQSQHLELFSAERIKILRIYDTTQELTGYYIMEVDGEICVYESDKTTLYFRTGLKAEELPAEVMSEVRNGKYMDNELQVYHFIESYSS